MARVVETERKQRGKRRAQGEGGLFVRNKGTDREMWVGRFQYPDGTRKDVYAKTQAKAREKLDALKKTAALGVKPTSDRLTVAAFLMDWLEDTVKPSLR